MWPAFSTSNLARTSIFFSTTAAKLRSNLARSPGATFFQVSKAFWDLVIAATVSLVASVVFNDCCFTLAWDYSNSNFSLISGTEILLPIL